MYESISENSGQFELVSLKPDGGSIRFSPPALPGFREFSFPKRFFITDSQVFVLATANAIDPNNPSARKGFSTFLFVYNYQGNLDRTITLEPGLNPLSFAVFESGNILLVMQDRFSKRTRLIVANQDGSKRSELSLFDYDHAEKMEPPDRQPGPDASADLLMALSTAQYLPSGRNLLIVPRQSTSLPILEVSEQGVLRQVALQLPKGRLVDTVLPADRGNWVVRTGVASKDALSSAAGGSSAGFLTDRSLYEFDQADGRLVGTTTMAENLWPVCKRDGQFIFLTTRPEDGHMQIVRGSSTR